MGEILWMNFLEEEIEDIQVVLITIGINGILRCFEDWLQLNGHLSKKEDL